MANKRDLVLDQYGISKHRYRELANFCLQYKEFKAEKNSCYSLDGLPIDGMPHSTTISNPTANKAERAYKLGKNIEVIESTAIEACGNLYTWILKAVTQDMSWFDFVPSPPCKRDEFNLCRRRFYYLLSLKK